MSSEENHYLWMLRAFHHFTATELQCAMRPGGMGGALEAADKRNKEIDYPDVERSNDAKLLCLGMDLGYLDPTKDPKLCFDRNTQNRTKSIPSHQCSLGTSHALMRPPQKQFVLLTISSNKCLPFLETASLGIVIK